MKQVTLAVLVLIAVAICSMLGTLALGDANQQRIFVDTAAQFTATNPLLGPGDIGFETDTRRLKVGTGQALWTQLSYATVYSISTAGTITAATVYGTAIKGATVTMTTGTVGQVACFTTGGLLSTCSTTVNGAGACTCP
jgi:hypothetical protein